MPFDPDGDIIQRLEFLDPPHHIQIKDIRKSQSHIIFSIYNIVYVISL